MDTRESISELRGVLVIAREEGAQLGNVANFFVDPGKKTLAGLSFRQSRFGKPQYVDMKNVVQLGRDVVSITSEHAAGELPADTSYRDLKSLQGLWVTTLGGAHLGVLVDLDVSQQTWMISELTLDDHRSLSVDPTEITIGVDEILVPTDYADKIEASSEPTRGFLRRALGAEAIDDIGTAVSRAVHRTKRDTPARPPPRDTAETQTKAEREDEPE